MVEEFKDLAIDGSSSYHVYRLRDVNLNSINNFWLE
jgi:hypothetical protein